MCFKLLLLSNRVSLTDPRDKLIIKFGETVQTKGVQVISRRKGFDARETRMFKSARKNEMTNQIVSPHLDGDKRHSHLESDAGFLRKNSYRPTRFNHSSQCVK